MTQSAAVPVTDEATIELRHEDRNRTLRGVRLQQEVRVPGDELDFTWADGAWHLVLDAPAVNRLEYLLELTHADGRTETVPDPANPRRAPGAFGEKSVLELPAYRPPRWLSRAAPAGSRRTVAVAARAVQDDVVAAVWSPEGLRDDEPALLLVVHDGPEYDSLAGLTDYLAVLVADGDLPPVRAALLDPGSRNDRYSGNGPYTRALCLAVIPRLHQEVATTATVGVGASLGALAMLHAQRQHGGCLDAMFLQSGSFFHPRHDAHERRFSQYDRVVRTVETVLRATGHPSPVPTVLTCGTIEENLANNRIMARALGSQGYDVTLREVRDVHNYTAWRDAFDPWLTRLLQQLAP